MRTPEAQTIMIQGTASSVGKTLIAAGLCRIFYRDGLSVAPFKAKNIGLNSGVTLDGGEMGRGQIVQAKAAGIEPTVDMNPILVKPEKGMGGQLIVRGKIATAEQTEQYYRDRLWSVAQESLDRLRRQYAVVVMEGAGSPAEPNLMATDIANLKLAKYAKAPIILVGDIDPGGVFAFLEGTVNIIRRGDPEAAALIKALVINKFRGERQYLEPALAELISVTGVPVLGVIPFISDHGIADEDTYKLEDKSTDKEGTVLDAVVLRTPSLQNSDDFDPLIAEPGVQVRFVTVPWEFGQPDLVILGGSKGTVSDLEWLRQRGFEDLMKQHAGQGGAVLGICGGFQMLGRSIQDPYGVESAEKEVPGFGLLPTVTIFEREKITRQVTGKVTANEGLLAGAGGMEVKGYEIHMGRTTEAGRPLVSAVSVSPDGWVAGTYLHDILRNSIRRLLLENLATRKGVRLPPAVELIPGSEYDSLARAIRESIDMSLLYKILERKV